jgi:beta-galactosidase
MVYGPYYWSGEEFILAMEGGRGPAAVNEVMDHPMKLGLISWTAHAYYTFHPTRTPGDRARSGAMTVFRVPRPGLMWWKSELLDIPFLHIESEWKEGIKELKVYSNAEEIELVVNGKDLGRYAPAKGEDYQYLKHPPFHVKDVEFEEGELTVIGLVNGEEVVRESVHTPDKPYMLELELDMEGRDLTADGSDIVVAYAKVLDREGNPVRDAQYDVQFSVEGPASVVGDGLGIGSNPRYCTYGIAPALIRTGLEAGEITVKAEARGLKAAEATVTSQVFERDVVAANASPIYDFEKIRVDIGEHRQLVQFDWTPWNGDDNASSVKAFRELGGFAAELKAAQKEELLRWLGEINVMGKYGFAMGEGVLCMDPEGLVLTFTGLKEGIYQLTTWHHAPRSNTDSMDPNQELQVTAQIFQLPYATTLDIELADADGIRHAETQVTFGKAMHEDPFGSAELIFRSNGTDPVTLKFTDPDKEKGVWLNAFELGL